MVKTEEIILGGLILGGGYLALRSMQQPDVPPPDDNDGDLPPPPDINTLNPVISARPLEGFAPLSVEFELEVDTATPRVTWSFGNGTTSTIINPNTIYTVAGEYYPTVRVTDAQGRRGNASFSKITVWPIQPVVFGVWILTMEGVTTLTPDEGTLAQLQARSTVEINGQLWNRSLRYWSTEAQRNEGLEMLRRYYNA
jgi:hypothetical protein